MLACTLSGHFSVFANFGGRLVQGDGASNSHVVSKIPMAKRVEDWAANDMVVGVELLSRLES